MSAAAEAPTRRAQERPTPGAPRWAVEGRGWPHAAASRFVRAGGIEWHVQIAGPAKGTPPDLLLLHGLGGATHSWRGQIGPLSKVFRVIVPDLPGHGFTGRPAMNGLSLPGQSRLVGALLEALGARPAMAVAHSAGAAILARMALDGRIAPGAILSVNGAFLPFPGVAGQVFPSLARLMTLNPFVPRFFALGAVMDPASIERLITGIGSRLDRDGLALYRRLLRCPAHVQNALSMMARWELEPLKADLPRLEAPLILAAGSADRAVTPGDAEVVAGLVPNARLVPLGGLGHLAHEEAPDRANALILETARRVGVLPANAA
ncbi:MAG: alpha/beta fold hydrolase BchO [Pseudomonadota bacterium]